MNNIFKLSGILLMIMLLVSCEEKEWVENEVELVPVFAVTDLQKTSTAGLLADPALINIYKTVPIHIETIKSAAYTKNFVDYNDGSTTEEFKVEYLYDERLPYKNGAMQDTLDNAYYEYYALKETNAGTMMLSEIIRDDAGNNVDTVLMISYNIMIQESEVYY